MNHINLCRPLLLSPDNFTPLQRTPWGGQKIPLLYKHSILPERCNQLVGESWEFSCDPSMPSGIKGCDISLPDLLTQSAEHILSPAIAAGPGCEILVKLLDTRSPLSFQVHPEDQDPELAPDECGKPESWLILDAAENAGIYLGFSKAVTKELLRQQLRQKADLTEYLHFIPVAKNDYFEIAPGVPHAIGAGITLLEPQRILSGKSGKTYRLWDWNRRYSEEGTEVTGDRGRARELHIEACLRIMEPEHHVGTAFANSLRSRPISESPVPGINILNFPKNPWYRARRFEMKDSTQPLGIRFGHSGYAFLLPLSGQLSVRTSAAPPTQIPAGQPALLPWAGRHYHLTGSENGTDFVLITPAMGEEIFDFD